MAHRRDTNASIYTTSSQESRESSYSMDSVSTDPSSYESVRPSTKGSSLRSPKSQASCQHEDLSPATSLYPRSSVETYSSRASYEEYEESDVDDFEEPEIPIAPIYCHEIEDINVRPSTPEGFAALFPSLTNKLLIRHDDLTPDGNMNLRVDTVVNGRRKKTIQLFHLRMRDLNRREFSLRRYCRDSGREVCNSKRKYVDPSETRHSKLQSVSTAMKTLTRRPSLRRSPTSGSLLPNSKSRPETSYSGSATEDEVRHSSEHSFTHEQKQKARPAPTNTIKLEFSNYARVDVQRRGHKSKKYEFEWWDHKYVWRRVTDKLTGTISYHLFCDGNRTPVAHIVPEARTPNQILIDEEAGGWIPPYQMWLSDQRLIDVATDVADVVVATGLMALVDDCIKTRWSPRKHHSRRFSLSDIDTSISKSRSFVHHLFHRRLSDHQQRPHSPHRSHSQRSVAPY